MCMYVCVCVHNVYVCVRVCIMCMHVCVCAVVARGYDSAGYGEHRQSVSSTRNFLVGKIPKVAQFLVSMCGGGDHPELVFDSKVVSRHL